MATANERMLGSSRNYQMRTKYYVADEPQISPYQNTENYQAWADEPPQEPIISKPNDK